jgi:hypothetical protein
MVPASATNHMFRSAPAVISPGPEFGRGSVNSVMMPAGVMRPILLALNSESQILPSGPAARARGPLSGGRDGELGDDARRRNATDLAAGKLTEPDVAVGTERDRARQLLETRAVGGSSDRCGYRRSE